MKNTTAYDQLMAFERETQALGSIAGRLGTIRPARNCVTSGGRMIAR
jgi:hypothetical protein